MLGSAGSSALSTLTGEQLRVLVHLVNAHAESVREAGRLTSLLVRQVGVDPVAFGILKVELRDARVRVQALHAAVEAARSVFTGREEVREPAPEAVPLISAAAA